MSTGFENCPDGFKTSRTVNEHYTREIQMFILRESFTRFLICVALCLCISADIIVTDGPLIGFWMDYRVHTKIRELSSQHTDRIKSHTRLKCSSYFLFSSCAALSLRSSLLRSLCEMPGGSQGGNLLRRRRTVLLWNLQDLNLLQLWPAVAIVRPAVATVTVQMEKKNRLWQIWQNSLNWDVR